MGRSVAVDVAGDIYITGLTNSSNFPATLPADAPEEGGANAFVVKLRLSGTSFRYSVVVGGSEYDEPYALAVDGAGIAYVTGGTESSDFPTAQPFQASPGGGESDAFVFALLCRLTFHYDTVRSDCFDSKILRPGQVCIECNLSGFIA